MMAYFSAQRDSTRERYHPYSAADFSRYHAYRGVIPDPYSGQGRTMYHPRYTNLQQHYHWYSMARGSHNPWAHPYMVPHYGAEAATRYAHQSWAALRQQRTQPDQSYRHQFQLPYLLFHQLHQQPQSLSDSWPNRETVRTESPLQPSNERMDPPLHCTGPMSKQPQPKGRDVQTPCSIQSMAEVNRIPPENVHRPNEIGTAKDIMAATRTKEVSSSSNSKFNPLPKNCGRQADCVQEGLRAFTNQLSSVTQGTPRTTEYTPPSSISVATSDIMGQIMGQARSERTGKQYDTANPLTMDSRSTVGLLKEEMAGKVRRDVFNDTVALNLSGTVPADKDLEELIVIDQHLDDILNSLEKSELARLRTAPRSQEVTHTTNRKPRLTHNATELKPKPRRTRSRVQHICGICGQRFTCRASKTVHMRIHSGERPYECPHCMKRFAQRSSMMAHIRIHTGTKPYTCTECGKTFTDYSTWQKHCRLHTGEKPYKCRFCKKGFAQSQNLKRHYKTHDMSGELPGLSVTF